MVGYVNAVRAIVCFELPAREASSFCDFFLLTSCDFIGIYLLFDWSKLLFFFLVLIKDKITLSVSKWNLASSRGLGHVMQYLLCVSLQRSVWKKEKICMYASLIMPRHSIGSSIRKPLSVSATPGWTVRIWEWLQTYTGTKGHASRMTMKFQILQKLNEVFVRAASCHLACLIFIQNASLKALKVCLELT